MEKLKQLKEQLKATTKTKYILLEAISAKVEKVLEPYFKQCKMNYTTSHSTRETLLELEEKPQIGFETMIGICLTDEKNYTIFGADITFVFNFLAKTIKCSHGTTGSFDIISQCALGNRFRILTAVMDEYCEIIDKLQLIETSNLSELSNQCTKIQQQIWEEERKIKQQRREEAEKTIEGKYVVNLWARRPLFIEKMLRKNCNVKVFEESRRFVREYKMTKEQLLQWAAEGSIIIFDTFEEAWKFCADGKSQDKASFKNYIYNY